MINEKPKSINEEFIEAVQEGNIEKVKGLLEKGADINFQKKTGAQMQPFIIL